MVEYQIVHRNSRIIDKKKKKERKENADLKSCIFFPCRIALGFHLRPYTNQQGATENAALMSKSLAGVSFPDVLIHLFPRVRVLGNDVRGVSDRVSSRFPIRMCANVGRGYLGGATLLID